MDLGFYLKKYDDAATKLSHALYKLTEREQWVMLTSDTVEKLLETATLPKPQEQLDNFILWLGQKQPASGHAIGITPQTEAAVGVADITALGFICSHAIDSGMVMGVIRQTLSGYGFGP